MELPPYINLDYLLSVKYTRSVDVSNCISHKGITFVIDTKEILHKKKVELCISKRIGLRVRFNNKWYKELYLLLKQIKKASNQTNLWKQLYSNLFITIV